ncbi:MAG: sporulation initiation factor Spo0A C-terminal domain-containing protein [Oscillospiraceae bacterium]|nr:sporulation initiation factor Spo0A C-terminal domain-containing protein [Oscillospiraceae bacterium]
MRNLENKLNAVMWFIIAEGEQERDRARDTVLGLLEAPKVPDCRDREIRNKLLELGVPDHLKGHGFLISAISMVCREPRLTGAITTELYPAIAAQHGETPSRVERAIRHAVEVCWERGDLDVLQKYFGNTVSASRGKPTNGEFIARVANSIR